MSYDFSVFKNKTTEIEDWLKKELSSIHTGRATPVLLDNVTVDSYGTKSAVSHVASITAEDARTLRVVPWDKAHIKTIEKAINDADMGLSVSADDKGIRVFFPELTTERRQNFVKVVKDKLEESRVSIRGVREDSWEDIQEKEKEGEMSEDDKFRAKDELQKLTDEANNTLIVLAEKKESDIMS